MKSTFTRLSGKLIIITLVAYCVLRFAPPAQAHILLTDKSIGAVVHISPDDDPIAGQPADFFFEFKDKESKFNPSVCDCIYQVKQDDKIIASGDLFSSSQIPSLDNASFSLIFPEPGMYTLMITGKAKIAGAFEEFTLSDAIRIERTTENPSSKSSEKDSFFSNHWIHFVVFGLGGVIFLLLLFFKSKKTA